MNIDFARSEYGVEEKKSVERVLSSNWLASGKENEAFEEEFAEYVGAKYAVCVNSGSSANLLALAARGYPPGSKILTAACGFPQTVAPILHLGFEPVLVDYDIDTHNINLNQVEDMVRLDPSIRAIIIAHTMGNPVDMKRLLKIAARNLNPCSVIEDCCEAVGSKIYDQYVGTFGRSGTYSFYPAHQITALGGGGMVVTNDKDEALIMKSMRDWGKTWEWNDHLGDMKTEYLTDVDGIRYYKGYTYKTLGWNFKLPEACAAFGRVQLKRLDEIGYKRLANYAELDEKAEKTELFHKIKVHEEARPNWFGYTMTLKDSNNDWNRNSLCGFLESTGIRTRPFFAGNITRHSPFTRYKKYYPVAEKLMLDSFFVGLWQGLKNDAFDYMIRRITQWHKRSLRFAS